MSHDFGERKWKGHWRVSNGRDQRRSSRHLKSELNETQMELEIKEEVHMTRRTLGMTERLIRSINYANVAPHYITLGHYISL